MEETTEKKEKTIKAKTISLISKIVGGVILLGGFALKALKIFDCETDDLLKISFALVGLCGTIDLNILVDKFTTKKEV